jgi:hypothetical protein
MGVKIWTKRFLIIVACGLAMFGLSLRLAINYVWYVALWWLLLPEPYARILFSIINFGTMVSIFLLGLIIYIVLKQKVIVKSLQEDLEP